MPPVSETPDEKPSRRLLLVSYWYPPAVGAAAERIVGFARYLPEHGWQPHVLTAQRDSPPPDIAGVTLDAVRDPRATPGPTFADYDPRQRPPRWKAILRDRIFPDRFAAWQKVAFLCGRESLRQQPCDLILASFPPASVVQPALRLHLDSGVPLVLDFRDLWIGPGGYAPRREKAIRAHMDLQRRAISHAAALVAVSEPMADHLAEEQQFDRDRVFVIPNGYEPSGTVPPPSQPTTQGDETGGQTTVAQRPIIIAHVGTVIPRNRPDLFFDSVASIAEHPTLGDVRFKFVGNLSRDYLREVGLASVIESTGLVAREEAREHMQHADALLLLTGSYVGRWGYNAKVFEYIQTGRPILCVEESPGSNDRKLLERFYRERSFFAPAGDAEALAEQIDRIKQYLATRSAAALELDGAFRDYSRPALAAALATKLHDLLDE